MLSLYLQLLYSVENYTKFLQESLDYLHKEVMHIEHLVFLIHNNYLSIRHNKAALLQVPRALVNLVEPLYILPLREMHVDSSLNCPTWLLK